MIGIQNGMVMQRGADQTCDIWVTSDREIRRVHTDDGQTASVTPDGGRFRIRGILTGGPYTLHVDDQVFREIYVGDVWILAGQSNMQGCGRSTEFEINANPAIRAYYMQHEWTIANHPLHEMIRSPYGVHAALPHTPRSFTKRGIGPGLAFAQRMYALTSAPQGLICCAHGATSLAQWDSELAPGDPNRSLYAAMQARVAANGAHVRGVFWSQGCADANVNAHAAYGAKTAALFRRMRADFGADLPIVYLQLARCILGPASDITADSWNSVQTQQRALLDVLPHVDMIPTSACRISDRWHLAGDAQVAIGRSAADSMFTLLHGELYGCVPSIRLRNAAVYPDEEAPQELCTVVLRYENVVGALNGGARPLGFSVSEPGRADWNHVVDCAVCGDRVWLIVGLSAAQLRGKILSYGAGSNPPCNIVDSAGRSLPVQLGIPVTGAEAYPE